MSADGDHPQTDTDGRDDKATYPQHARALLQYAGHVFHDFGRWVWKSISDAQHIPHYLVAVFTFLLVVFAYDAWDESTKGTAALQGQLTLLGQQQRPWIKVDAEKFDDLHLADWPGLPFKFFVENVGATPAFNVDVRPRSFIYADGHTDLFGEQKAYCAAAQKTRIAGDAGMLNASQAVMVFPKDRVAWERFGAIMGTGISIFEMEKYSPKPENGKQRNELSLWVYGCVTYDFGRPNTIHQTGFVYRIARLIKHPPLPDAMSYSVNPDETVPKDQIILFPSSSAEGITN